MNTRVDKDTCIGCGLCPSICSEVYDMDDDGKAKAVKSDVPENLQAEVKEAEAGCPVSAIIVE